MQDVKAYLRSYIPTLRYAQLCFRELDMAMDVSIKSPRLDGMPRGGSLGGLELQVAEIEALRRKAEKAREKVLAMLDQIENMIDGLDDMDQKMVIKMRYIYGCQWAEIAVSANMAERTVYYLHGKALAELRKKQKEAF